MSLLRLADDSMQKQIPDAVSRLKERLTSIVGLTA